MKSSEFIAESPEEDIQLVKFSSEVAAKLYARHKSWGSSIVGDFKLVLGGVTANDISVKVPNDTIVGNVINTLKYLIYSDDENVGGRFFPADFEIMVNSFVFDKLSKNEAVAAIQNVIIHEIRHAVDYVKSHKAAFAGLMSTTAANSTSIGYDAYLRHPAEVNARYTEAVLKIANGLPTANLKSLITSSLRSTELTPEILGSKRYNHIISRAYRFFDQYKDNTLPVEQSWIRKVVNFIIG